MARKIDRLFNYISLMVIAGGGMILHTLTSLTIKSYYGDPWGYVSFLLPGFSELYLVSVQLGDNMYNYTILLVTFITIISVLGILKLVSKVVRSRGELIMEENA
jgi:hypothetical protein